MKPKTWQILSLFEILVIVLQVSVICKYCFVFSFLFRSETENLHIRFFKVIKEKSPDLIRHYTKWKTSFFVECEDLWSHYPSSIYDTELFAIPNNRRESSVNWLLIKLYHSIFGGVYLKKMTNIWISVSGINL